MVVRVKAQNRTFPDDLDGGCKTGWLIINDLRQLFPEARPVLMLWTRLGSRKPASEAKR